MISAYEQIRLTNIEKNNQFLCEIGIDPTKSNIQKVISKKERKRSLVVAVEPSRKSSRLLTLSSVNYKEESVTIPKTNTYSKLINNADVNVEIDPIYQHDIKGRFINADNVNNANENTTKIINHVSSNSSSSIHANKQLFLSSYLCKPVELYGKAAVMAMSNGGVLPKFSKYSGVVEWRNAVYVWVNIGGKSGYHNAFTEGGRYMMWYGSSRMHADSPITTRMLHTTSEQTATKTADEDILLFVRKENCNYVCLGRLSVSGYDLSREPISYSGS